MQSDHTDTNQPHAKAKRPLAGLVSTVIVFAAVGMLLFYMISGQTSAPTPGFMPVTTDLASMQFSEDKPVVAVVTADWCGPCQDLKKNALADDRVVELLTSRAQPVMIDGTDSGKASETLRRLGVRVFPTTIVLRQGVPVAMLEGNMSAERYLAWLDGQL